MAYEDNYKMVRVPLDTWALIKETGRIERREVGNQLVHLIDLGVVASGVDLDQVDLNRPVYELEQKRLRQEADG